ncbi:hypothetical protein [Nonomuraea sp. B5E05]|uniref:hypothetical protein n=1 Tax=Nonomuraea sp. B5E05 TaxID=3153569 RepID=UPI003260FCCA
MLGWTAAAVTVGVVWAALATGVTPLVVPTLCVLRAVMLTALIAWNHYNYQPWWRFVTPAGEDIHRAATLHTQAGQVERQAGIRLRSEPVAVGHRASAPISRRGRSARGSERHSQFRYVNLGHSMERVRSFRIAIAPIKSPFFSVFGLVREPPAGSARAVTRGR